MADLGSLSRWQVIYQYFDDAMLPRNNTILRVRNIENRTKLTRPEIKADLAEKMSEWERKRQERMQQKRRHNAARFDDSFSEQTGGESESGSASERLADVLGQGSGVEPDESGIEPKEIPAANIEIYQIGPEAEIDTKIYPTGFHCQNCDLYKIFDIASSVDFSCPNCSKQMYQLDIVYGCPRCAKVEPLLPQFLENDPDDLDQGIPLCQECNDGHMRLKRADTLGNTRWKCDECGATERLQRNCPECHIRADEDISGQPGPSVMKPQKAVSSSLMSPLISNYLEVQGERVTLANLEQAYQDTQQIDQFNRRIERSSLSEDSNDEASGEDMLITRFFNLESIFTVPTINNSTVLYGYRAAFQSYMGEIDESERLAQFFTLDRDPGGSSNMYKTYLAETEGRGLIFNFDSELFAETVCNMLGRPKQSYESLAAEELERVQDVPFDDLLSEDGSFPIVGGLHAIEHALFDTARNQIGLDNVLGSKILVEDGAVLLYEREEVGTGGLVQLMLGEGSGQQRPGVKQYLREAANQLNSCGQRCSDGCPACIFVNDFQCHPFLPHEVDRWIPANSILNRTVADEFISSIPE